MSVQDLQTLLDLDGNFRKAVDRMLDEEGMS